MSFPKPDLHILRIMDANVNRAVEGIRVMEETARLVFNDRSLTTSLKHIRHSLVDCIQKEKKVSLLLLSSRRVDDDVLREGETSSEKKRDSLLTIVKANAMRAEEAVRTLEEFTKLTYPQLSAKFKQIRFRLYKIEQILTARVQLQHLVNKERQKLYAILVNTKAQLTDIYGVTQSVIDAGAGTIGYHANNLSGKALFTEAEKFVDICSGHKVTTIIFGRPDVAMILRADGVHLGIDDIPVHACRNITGEYFVIGKSITLNSKKMAYIKIGANYIIVDMLPLVEQLMNRHIQRLNNIASHIKIPMVVMVNRYDESVREVFSHGAIGLAFPLDISNNKTFKIHHKELRKYQKLVQNI